MKSTFVGIVIITLICGVSLFGAETDWELEPMKPDLKDQDSLQRGLALYRDFCFGCHSLQYQRYEKTADDLGIPHDLMEEYVLVTGEPIGSYMSNSMSMEDAKKWFGAAPPDLTMVTRVRSPKWVYNFLQTFYIDESRPFGVNNKVFPNVAMPHALLPLQGVAIEECFGYQSLDVLLRDEVIEAAIREGTYEPEEYDQGFGRELNCPELKVIAGTGSMSEEEFEQATFDIVNFLHYMGDPSRQARMDLGKYVIGFLIVLLIFAYLLRREYWKDIPKPARAPAEHTPTEH